MVQIIFLQLSNYSECTYVFATMFRPIFLSKILSYYHFLYSKRTKQDDNECT